VDETALGGITGTATVESDSHDPDTTDNVLPITVTVVPKANLSLAGSLPDSADVSEPFTMDLSITNHGPDDANDAEISLPFPAGITLVDTSGCTAALENELLQCEIGAIAKDASKDVSIRLKATSANDE